MANTSSRKFLDEVSLNKYKHLGLGFSSFEVFGKVPIFFFCYLLGKFKEKE